MATWSRATDRKRAKLAADRIFTLIDRESAIDPLAEEDVKGVEFDKDKPNCSADFDSSGEHAV